MAERRATRAATLAGVVAGVGMLAGCSVSGEVVVGLDDVVVDVRASHGSLGPDQGGPCDINGISGLEVTDREERDGTVTCRLAGTLSLQQDSDQPGILDIIYARDETHQFLVLPAYFFPPDQTADVDLVFHFAGPVVAASVGEVSGSSVRWRDPEPLPGKGFSATARLGAAPPGGLVAGGAGLALGAVAVWGVSALRSGRDADGGTEGAEEPTLDAAPASGPEPPGPTDPPDEPEDPSVWAPDHG